jgi:hypothetical protein
MYSANTLALKEWAVVVQALKLGQQTLLLRKGGLHERRGRFATEPTEFFLFPTYVHQMQQGIVSEAAADLQAVMAMRPPADQLHLDCYATVEDLVWLSASEQAAVLDGLHYWTAETVAHRFAYGKTPGLHLFVLRVYRLPRSYCIPSLKRYGGCRSWVELETALSTAGATPVLSDAAFAQQVEEIRNRLSSCPSAALIDVTEG